MTEISLDKLANVTGGRYCPNCRDRNESPIPDGISPTFPTEEEQRRNLGVNQGARAALRIGSGA